MTPGKYIAYEGGEGGGKSTQIRLLADRLRKSGIFVVVTREPGGTVVGEEIRNILLSGRLEQDTLVSRAELFLMNSGRVQQIETIIRPNLAQGNWVLSDRSFWSSLAYQGYGRGLDLEYVHQVCKLAVGETIPDLTFLLNVSTKEGLGRRMLSQETNRLDMESAAFHLRVKKGFLEVAKKYGLTIIDASGTIEEIEDEIWSHVQPLLQTVALTEREGATA